MPSGQLLLQLKNVSQSYDGRRTVVNNLSLSLEKGKIGCLLGPSACGKTTVLRTISGFERIVSGEIFINQQLVSSTNWFVLPDRRHVGVVFQDYCLFPHLTISENVAFGLKQGSKRERNLEVEKWLHIVGLEGVGRLYPHQISGGQQQRVALARAMAPKPELLLLDEPFSNLDVDLRERLSSQVRHILKENHVTALLVTHDQHEAFAMADEIGVMNQGTIQQWGSAYSLYHEPANKFVADFVGQGVFLPAKVLEDKSLELPFCVVDVPGMVSSTVGSEIEILVRPDDVVFDAAGPVVAKVVEKAFRGAYILYTLEILGTHRVLAHLGSHHNEPIGSRIRVRFDLEHVIFFEKIKNT